SDLRAAMSAVIFTTDAAAWSASDWASDASAWRSTRSAAMSPMCFSSSVSDAWARSRSRRTCSAFCLAASRLRSRSPPFGGRALAFAPSAAGLPAKSMVAAHARATNARLCLNTIRSALHACNSNGGISPRPGSAGERGRRRPLPRADDHHAAGLTGALHAGGRRFVEDAGRGRDARRRHQGGGLLLEPRPAEDHAVGPAAGVARREGAVADHLQSLRHRAGL